MSCSGCSPVHPIEDQGEVRFTPNSHLLSKMLRGLGLELRIHDSVISVLYHTKDEVLGLLHNMRHLPDGAVGDLLLSVTGRGKDVDHSPWLSFKQWKSAINGSNMIEIVREGRFSSHMQPIVDMKEQIVGFEFLLRPDPNGIFFQPYELFEAARETGMHSFLDRAARTSAVEISSKWLTRGMKRFVNFLPSAIYHAESCLGHTFEVIDKLELDPSDFVFEVVETERLDQISHLLGIFKTCRSHGMAVALDDVGSGYSTMEVMSMLKPDYVKIDRSLIDHCDQDTAKRDQIRSIIERASYFGGQVLAEGMERREEFELCRDLGIHLAQGYLFGKPADRPPCQKRQAM